uniref:Protein ovarian tumor locus n=1 Tax=Drosophila rhopaloa TaxID=1041015 RepID=A0A6P4E7V0_DRORH
MMSGILKRTVCPGSKAAPDPIDRFLEQHLLFRKHVVMDASSLFRVVAEQVYDTQMLHYEVRMECVRYMFRKRRSFQRYISGDYDEYLWQLEKTKTKGTLLELRVLCHLYRRNVVIHEAYDLGKLLIFREDYPETLRIFVDRQEHFDTVLTMSDIEIAAVCQAVAFKMLYKMVFRLPDVNLAVEWMLYPQTFKWGTDMEFDPRGNVIRLLCSNGRSFKLDPPERTLCVLKNYKDCPFHNRKLELGQENFRSMPVSCMRRILEQNCLPFCYMAAKSMDPYMYRNVELNCLNACRREAKSLNIYTGDYNFKVGAKCQVELETNKHGELSICHIQAINKDMSACEVFVEGQGKLLSVPFDTVHPLPPDEFKPWDRLPKRRINLPRRVKMSFMKRQFLQLENASNSQYRRQNKQGENFKMESPTNHTKWETVTNQSPPLPPPPVQDIQLSSLPHQIFGMGPPKPRLITPPKPRFITPSPMVIPRPVFVQGPPPIFRPPGLMHYDRAFMQPRHLIIRPPGAFVLFAPPGTPPPPGMIPIVIGDMIQPHYVPDPHSA